MIADQVSVCEMARTVEGFFASAISSLILSASSSLTLTDLLSNEPGPPRPPPDPPPPLRLPPRRHRRCSAFRPRWNCRRGRKSEADLRRKLAELAIQLPVAGQHDGRRGRESSRVPRRTRRRAAARRFGTTSRGSTLIREHMDGIARVLPIIGVLAGEASLLGACSGTQTRS